MAGLSQRAYARHRGVTHRAVQKAIKAGRITTNSDGTIDAARADAQWTANTDPATRLFLGESENGIARDPESERSALRDVRLFGRAYPVGLFIADVGPVVANDAYSSPSV